MASVDSLIMGSATYRFIVREATSWPYGDRRTWVLTTRGELPVLAGAQVEWFAGDVRRLVRAVGAAGAGKTWVVGGGDVTRQLLEHDLVDEFELAVIPTLLGGGVPAFPPRFLTRRLQLLDATSFAAGVVLLRYHRLDGGARGAAGRDM